jgi:hypothetical protein
MMSRIIFLLLCVIYLLPSAFASPGILQVYCRILDRETGKFLDPQIHDARFFPDMDVVPSSVRKHTSDSEYTVINLHMPKSLLQKALQEVKNVPKSFLNCNSHFILLRADVALEEPVGVEIIADHPYFFGKPKQVRLLFKRILSEDTQDLRIWGAGGGHPYTEYVRVESKGRSRIALYERPNGPILGYVENGLLGERLRTDGNWVLVNAILGVFISISKRTR